MGRRSKYSPEVRERAVRLVLDSERLFEVLVTIVVLSFFVERALALVFEHRLYDRLQAKG